MDKLVIWIVKRVGGKTLVTLALLLIALGYLVFGIVETVGDLEAALVWRFAFIGLLLGWILARTQIHGWLAAILCSLIGIMFVVFLVGGLFDNLMSLLWEGIDFLRSLLSSSVSPDTDAFGSIIRELIDGVTVLFNRLISWIENIIKQQPTFDSVALGLVWGMVIWSIAVWAGWVVRRRKQPVKGILPAIILMVSSLVYVGGNTTALLPMLGSGVVLVALVRQDAREQEWDEEGISYSDQIMVDIGWTAVIISLFLLVLATIIPSISLQKIVDYTQRITVENINESDIPQAFGLEPRAIPIQRTVFDARRVGGLPRNHLLGAEPEISDQVVMTATVQFLQTKNPTSQIIRIKDNIYLRGLTYDRYTGHGWVTGNTEIVEYEAGTATSEIVPEKYLWVRQDVRLQDEEGLIYVVGNVLTADYRFKVAWRPTDEGAILGDAFGATLQTKAYRADSLTPNYSEAELRSTGEQYPDWVIERYLEIPENLPERVITLARKLTAVEPTPYDRARAIEGYLREFPYTLDLPDPPPDRDIVDYFIFDLKRGYCDYYASSMVVLARAAGVPARLVTGYVGKRDERRNIYIAREDNAHSWVEIYFPDVGWIGFEPTGGRPVFDISTEIQSGEMTNPGTDIEPITARRARIQLLLWISGIGGGIALLLFSWLIWGYIDRRKVERASPGNGIHLIFLNLYRLGARVGVSPRRSDTPFEFTSRLLHRLEAMKRDRTILAFLNPAVLAIEKIAWYYVQALYSPIPLQKLERRDAYRTWRGLRWRLWFASLITRIERVRRGE
jgi:transglutaminase-like putative cysteine protease